MNVDQLIPGMSDMLLTSQIWNPETEIGSTSTYQEFQFQFFSVTKHIFPFRLKTVFTTMQFPCIVNLFIFIFSQNNSCTIVTIQNKICDYKKFFQIANSISVQDKASKEETAAALSKIVYIVFPQKFRVLRCLLIRVFQVLLKEYFAMVNMF